MTPLPLRSGPLYAANVSRTHCTARVFYGTRRKRYSTQTASLAEDSGRVGYRTAPVILPTCTICHTNSVRGKYLTVSTMAIVALYRTRACVQGLFATKSTMAESPYIVRARA